MENKKLIHLKYCYGVTLVELVIVIMITSIIVLGVTMFLQQSFRTYFTTADIMRPQIQAQAAIETITRDLRTIRSTLDISNITSNSITFVDIDNKTVYYRLFNNQLQRKVDTITTTGSYQTLVSNVQNFIISYYDSTGVSVTQNNAIRYIFVTLTININNTPFTLNAGVYPWNLK